MRILGSAQERGVQIVDDLNEDCPFQEKLNHIGDNVSRLSAKAEPRLQTYRHVCDGSLYYKFLCCIGRCQDNRMIANIENRKVVIVRVPRRWFTIRR